MTSLINQIASACRLRTKLDSDGTTIIPGKLGHLYEWDERTLGAIFIPPRPMKGWLNRKRALQEMGWEVIQDGDMEGAAIIEIPTKITPELKKRLLASAKLIGIKQKRVISPENLAKLKAARDRISI